MAAGRLLENPEIARFTAHLGFQIRACRPYRVNTKGKVECPVGYVRDHFVYGRTIPDDSDLVGQTVTRLDTVAIVRRHGMTREEPQIRFQATLEPLAAQTHRSLVLTAPAPASPTRLPVKTLVAVERRALSTNAALIDDIAVDLIEVAF